MAGSSFSGDVKYSAAGNGFTTIVTADGHHQTPKNEISPHKRIFDESIFL
jgi:hypothetical protein